MIMYDTEISRVIREIKKQKAACVLIQLPDGLKVHAQKIVDAIEQNTNAAAYIWFSSCYGGCDYPAACQGMGIDLIIQFGHSQFKKCAGGW